jgi:general secretion pathway protein C
MSSFFLSKISKKLRGEERPPFERFYLFAFIVFVAYLVGDLSTLYVRQYLLPTTVPPKKMAPSGPGGSHSYTFSEIVANNIFNSDHKIPPSVGEMEGGGGGDEGTPRLSQLPLDLIGTIVHANPARSLATIMLRGQNKVEPYTVGQQIEGMAEIKHIQRERVIFRNLRTQGLEYIDIPQDQKIVISTEKPFTTAAPQKKEKTEFTLKRADVEKQLENLPKLLQAARVVPEISADGRVKGYRMVEMQPGSIYETLGLRLGDVLKGANGEDITNPQKAMELFQTLKNSDEINLVIDRNGKETSLNYKLTR